MPALHFGRAAQGIDDAGELDQEPVAGRLHHPAKILGDPAIDQITPDRPEAR
jgi:hypothetical protein